MKKISVFLLSFLCVSTVAAGEDLRVEITNPQDGAVFSRDLEWKYRDANNRPHHTGEYVQVYARAYNVRGSKRKAVITARFYNRRSKRRQAYLFGNDHQLRNEKSPPDYRLGYCSKTGQRCFDARCSS